MNAEYIQEPERTLPVRYADYDVIVAGGGIAGIAAALAAARAGKRVLLLERMFALGGLATLGLVTIYLPLCDGKGHQLSFGLAEELLKLSIREGWERDYPDTWLSGSTEHGRQRYKVRYNAQVFAILAEQDKIRRCYTQLGKVYYKDYVTDEEPDDAEYDPLCERISQSFRRINRLRLELEAAKTKLAGEQPEDEAEPVAKPETEPESEATAEEEDFADNETPAEENS